MKIICCWYNVFIKCCINNVIYIHHSKYTLLTKDLEIFYFEIQTWLQYYRSFLHFFFFLFLFKKMHFFIAQWFVSIFCDVYVVDVLHCRRDDRLFVCFLYLREFYVVFKWGFVCVLVDFSWHSCCFHGCYFCWDRIWDFYYSHWFGMKNPTNDSCPRHSWLFPFFFAICFCWVLLLNMFTSF